MMYTSANDGHWTAMAAMTIVGLPSLIVFLLLQRFFMEVVTNVKSPVRAADSVRR